MNGDNSAAIIDLLFAQTSADLVLRPSDHVDFRTHCNILSQAFTIFADMFSLPQPYRISDESSTFPIVNVAEVSKTLQRPLLLCYRVNKPEPALQSLDDILLVLKAARKYVMECRITLLARDLLALIPSEPLRLGYCVLDEVVTRTTSDTQARAVPPTSPISVLDTMLLKEGLDALDGVSAGYHHRLRESLRSSSLSDTANPDRSGLPGPSRAAKCRTVRVRPQRRGNIAGRFDGRAA